MKLLSDFNLSIVLSLGDRVKTFMDGLSLWKEYYERNGIEVVVLVDSQTDYSDLLKQIRKYPFVSWKVVVDSGECPWRNTASVYNEGIRQSTKQYILFTYSEFGIDSIYELRKNMDECLECFATDSLDNSLLIRKEYLEQVGGFDERLDCWKVCLENMYRRLGLAGYHWLHYSDILSQKEDISTVDRFQSMPVEIVSDFLLSTQVDVQDVDPRISCKVVYDWQEHPYAKEQIREYLSGLRQYDIPADNVFDKTYPLIALIPTYNESERIADCLHSVEKYCDGIILLDDDSRDDTYEIARSDKLLLKAKKVRTEFNDRQNRNILLDLASFFKAGWFIFIDADERFDDRFMDLREVMKRDNVDTVGVWIANLWGSMDTYRVDMEDVSPYSKNGLWFRLRMFRNKGRMLLMTQKKLHFPSVPFIKRTCASKTLLLHVGYLYPSYRKAKRIFYQNEKDLSVNVFYQQDTGKEELRCINEIEI